MPISDSTARPNAVKIPGLVEYYTTTLQRRGYGPVATHAYKRAVEHFIAWSAPDSDYVEIGEAPFRRFLDEHLSNCSCAGRPQRGKVTALSALRHLQAMLRAAGSIPPAPSSFPGFVISELQDYGDFANDVCGLAAATLISRRQWIGKFLIHAFPFGGLEFSRLGPKAVRDFSPRNARAISLAAHKSWHRLFGAICGFAPCGMQIRLRRSWPRFPRRRAGGWLLCRSTLARRNSPG